MIQRTRLLPRETYVRDARLFVVAVEGEVEEPWYFGGLLAAEMIPRHRVRLVLLGPESGESAPEHVAARLGRYEATHRLIDADARWLVVDVDRHHNLKETLAAARATRWSFAVSNPCFEVWLQLHFVESAEGTGSKEAKARWRALRTVRPEPWPFDRVAVEQACVRAERGLAGTEWIPPCPGTTVSRVVRELLAASSSKA